MESVGRLFGRDIADLIVCFTFLSGFIKIEFRHLEHFNIFCSHLGRREDEAGKEDCTAILKYCEQI